MSQERLEFVVSAQVSKAVEGLDKLGREMKKLGRDVMEVTGMLTGVGAVMVANATKYNGAVARAVGDVTNSYNVLTVKIATALIPAIRQLESFLNRLIGVWDSLTPKQKGFVSDAAIMVTKIAAIGGAIAGLGKMTGMIAGIASAFVGLLSPVGLVTAAIAAAVAGLLMLHGQAKLMLNEKNPTGDRVLPLIEAKKKSILEIQQTRDYAAARNAKFGENPEDTAIIKRANEALDEEIKALEQLIAASKKQYTLTDYATAAMGDFGKTARSVIDMLMGNGPEPKKPPELESLADFAAKIDRPGKALDIFADKLVMMGPILAKEQAERAKSLAKEMARTTLLTNRDARATARTTYFGMAELVRGMDFAGVTKKYLKDLEAAMAKGLDTTAIEIAYQEVTQDLTNTATGISAAVNAGLSTLGRVGSIIQSGISGFQTGGWWGAIIAVFAEILKENKKFAKVIEMSNAFTKKLAEGLDGLVQGIIPLLAAVNDISLVIMKSLQPVFLILGRVLQAIVPSLNVINQVLDVLVGIVNNLVGDMLGLGDSFNIVGIIANILKAETLMLVAVIASVIAGIIGAAGQLVIGFAFLVAGITRIVGALGVDTTGLVNLTMGIFNAGQKLVGTASGLQKQAEGWGDESKYIWGHINEGGIDAGNSLSDLADVADGLSESLTNVPTGYRIKGAQFNSSDAGIGNVHGASAVDITIDGDLAALVRAVRVADMRVNFNMSGASVQQRAAALGF